MTEGYPALETYVAVLSTGPVGPSDQIGTANKTLIMSTWYVNQLYVGKHCNFIDNFYNILLPTKFVIAIVKEF